jgi:hypothetical protein
VRSETGIKRGARIQGTLNDYRWRAVGGEGDLEGGLLYCGSPKDMLKRYIKREVKTLCKRIFVSIRAPLGEPGGDSLSGTFDRKG